LGSAINVYLTIIVMTITALLDSTVVPRLSIAGLHPDLTLVVVIAWSLLRGADEGVVWAFIGGLELDFLSGGVFGAHTIALLLTSFLSGLGELNVFRTSLFLPPITASVATLVYDTVLLGMSHLMGTPVHWTAALVRIILPTALINALLLSLLYLPLRWLHRLTGREEIGW